MSRWWHSSYRIQGRRLEGWRGGDGTRILEVGRGGGCNYLITDSDYYRFWVALVTVCVRVKWIWGKKKVYSLSAIFWVPCFSGVLLSCFPEYSFYFFVFYFYEEEKGPDVHTPTCGYSYYI